MAEEDINKIRTYVGSLANTSVFAMLTASIFASAFLIQGKSIKHRLEDINTSIQNSKYELKTENVLGNSEPEEFYLINGQRAYMKIDGKKIEGER